MSDEMKLQAFNKLRRMPNDALCELYNKIPDALPTSRKMMIKAIMEKAEINVVPVNPEQDMSDEVIKNLCNFKLLIKLFNRIGDGVNIPAITEAIGKVYEIHSDEVFVFKKGSSSNIRNFMEWMNKNREDEKNMIDFYKEGLERIREMVFLMRKEVFSACIGEVFDTAIISLKNRGQVNESFENSDLSFSHLVAIVSNAEHRPICPAESESIFACLSDNDTPINSVVDMTNMDQVAEDDPINESDDVVSDNPLEGLLQNIKNEKQGSVILCQGEAFKNPQFKGKIREAIKESGRYEVVNISTLSKKEWQTFRRHNEIKGHVEMYECVEPDNEENTTHLTRKDGCEFRGPLIIM